MTAIEELQRACKGALNAIDALLADGAINQAALRDAADACRDALAAAPRIPRGRYLRLMYDKDLARAHCSRPGCDHKAHEGRMFLHAQCHPRAAVEVAYNSRTACVEIACAVCKKNVCAVAVDGPSERAT